MSHIDLNISEKDGLKSDFIKAGSFAFTSGNKIQLFPFNTSSSSEKKEELKNFHGIVGELFRVVQGQGFPDEFLNKKTSFRIKLKDHILDTALNKVKSEHKAELEAIIYNLFFTNDSRLLKFNIKVLPYMYFERSDRVLKEISKYIIDIYFDDDLKLKIKKFESPNFENIFYELIDASLPQLVEKSANTNSETYHNLVPEIQSLFKKDLQFLIDSGDIFSEYIEEFIKLYYLIYLSQAGFRLNNFGNNLNISETFYTLDWESLSSSRLGYTNGWKSLESNLSDIFIHANLLGLLNYITINGEPIGDYNKINEKYNDLDKSERKILESHFIDIRDFFLTNTPSKLSQNSTIISLVKQFNGQGISDYLEHLFKVLKISVTELGREAAASRYESWLINFINFNYLKPRGRLGLATTFDQNQILFITKLCVGNQEKIRLNELWNEFKKRGFNFDDQSKTTLIKLFEKINLLEKKSDSGDAQYVKSSI